MFPAPSGRRTSPRGGWADRRPAGSASSERSRPGTRLPNPRSGSRAWRRRTRSRSESRSVWKNAPFFPSTRTAAGTTISDDMPSKGPFCIPPIWAAAGRANPSRTNRRTWGAGRPTEFMGLLLIFRAGASCNRDSDSMEHLFHATTPHLGTRAALRWGSRAAGVTRPLRLFFLGRVSLFRVEQLVPPPAGPGAPHVGRRGEERRTSGGGSRRATVPRSRRCRRSFGGLSPAGPRCGAIIDYNIVIKLYIVTFRPTRQRPMDGTGPNPNYPNKP